MRKLNISFRIKSKESSQSFQVVGEEKNSRIIFVDPDQNKNYILFFDDKLEYYKTGSVEMKYVFSLNEKTSGTYRVYGNQFDFQIVTDKLIVTSEQVYVEYRLIQGNELVNDTILELKYSPIKEDS